MRRRRRLLALLVVGVVAAGAVVVGVGFLGGSSSETPASQGLPFGKGVVEGGDTTRVTTLRFGPDGRL
ncbi:MAG TPA: hypothetical protein VFS16_10140, partial [Acidimicrobiia bacterium]|nr:hypothetical protein [Acidimicrobiia bacterium]